MRVKISYGADIEEVPEEIEQLFKYVFEKTYRLKNQAENIDQALAEEEIDLAIALIDKMRRTLSTLDSRLSDIEMISAGYLNYKEGDNDVSVRRPIVDPAGHTDVHGRTEQPSIDTES